MPLMPFMAVMRCEARVWDGDVRCSRSATKVLVFDIGSRNIIRHYCIQHYNFNRRRLSWGWRPI